MHTAVWLLNASASHSFSFFFLPCPCASPSLYIRGIYGIAHTGILASWGKTTVQEVGSYVVVAPWSWESHRTPLFLSHEEREAGTT